MVPIFSGGTNFNYKNLCFLIRNDTELLTPKRYLLSKNKNGGLTSGPEIFNVRSNSWVLKIFNFFFVSISRWNFFFQVDI